MLASQLFQRLPFFSRSLSHEIVPGLSLSERFCQGLINLILPDDASQAVTTITWLPSPQSPAIQIGPLVRRVSSKTVPTASPSPVAVRPRHRAVSRHSSGAIPQLSRISSGKSCADLLISSMIFSGSFDTSPLSFFH